MNPQDYAAIAVAVVTVVGGIFSSARFLVKHYLKELKPNGGSSLSDRLTRVEERVEFIVRLLDK